MRSAMVRRAASALVFTASLVGATVLAGSAKDEARQHFEAGNALVDNEDYTAATAEFELSVRLFPTKMGLFNLANCYKALNRYGDALEALQRLELEFAGKLGSIAGDVSSLRNTIEGMVGRLDVKVDKDGASIRVDGTETGVSPLDKPLVLAPGDHVIEAQLPGYTDASQTVRIAARERRDVSFILVEEPVAPPPAAVVASAPPLEPAPPTSRIDALLAQDTAAAKPEEIWIQVEEIARNDELPRVQRIADLQIFLAHYSRADNPYAEYAALLIEVLDNGGELDDLEMTWVRMEILARNTAAPPAHRIAALRRYVASLASYPKMNSPHLEYANLLIETIGAGDDPNDLLMDPARLRAKTEWFSLRGEGGTYGGGAMISMFTVRWRWVYWEIFRISGGGGVPSLPHGSVRWWSLMGTALGVPIHFGVTGRHEFRIGLGLMGGPMEEYTYSDGTAESDSDNSDKYDSFSFGPILEPEVSYVFHAARRFALQIGAGVYIATMKATVEGEGAHYELPAPIVNGFLGFRL